MQQAQCPLAQQQGVVQDRSEYKSEDYLMDSSDEVALLKASDSEEE